MAEMRRKYGKKLTPLFEHFDGGVFDCFCHNYWSQSHQNLLSCSRQCHLQIFFNKFFSNLKKYFGFLYIRCFKVTYQRRRDGVVVRAVEGKFEISGLNPSGANVFFNFFPLLVFRKCGRLRKCGRRRIF